MCYWVTCTVWWKKRPIPKILSMSLTREVNVVSVEKVEHWTVSTQQVYVHILYKFCILWKPGNLSFGCHRTKCAGCRVDLWDWDGKQGNTRNQFWQPLLIIAHCQPTMVSGKVFKIKFGRIYQMEFVLFSRPIILWYDIYMWWVSYVMIALPSGQALSVTKTCLVKQGGSSEYFFAVLYFILETLPPKPLAKHYVDIICRHLRKEVSIQHIHSL